MKVLREIGIIARALDSIANIEFRDLELARGQYLYLVRIGEQPGIIQEELSDLLKVDRSTVARSVKKLADKGLIRELTDPSNQKIKKWILTEKGQKLYPFILAEHAYSEKTALKGFSQEEILQLEEWLAKMSKNVAADWELVKKGQKRNYSEEKK
ncbi:MULTISPECIES: MarR family winged helix-turn-helix transcriptional regulator [Streptococcus]|uniref:MarR family winged helix-turn-helix transcriptional regulator n=1 Tax=Streptococcus TaxID=1301 RepID=UPI0007792CFB|nr:MULTISPECIES: MarR family transcriptional regulator [Streptococcus]AMP66794.1 MarR family transcriptional regulator [Streptococcus sp. A12]RSK08975.1 transcriptional regulator SlyA [Streptococcus australis]